MLTVSHMKAHSRGMASALGERDGLLSDRLPCVQRDMEKPTGKVLICIRELSNVEDRYAIVNRCAVAVVKMRQLLCHEGCQKCALCMNMCMHF